MTDKDKKLLSEFCGIRLTYSNWVMPDGKEYSSLDDVILDDNFYFKYAVPKLMDLEGFRLLNYQFVGFAREIDLLRHSWGIHFEDNRRTVYGSARDSTEAFGQALLKVIKGAK